MLELFRSNCVFGEIKIDENPFLIRTEREKAVEDKDLSVFRSLFQR